MSVRLGIRQDLPTDKRRLCLSSRVWIKSYNRLGTYTMQPNVSRGKSTQTCLSANLVWIAVKKINFIG